MVHLLTEGSPAFEVHFLLAHGAGAPMTSPFMERITRLLAERSIAVSRFEFAYMAGRREDGKRRPPPKAERLVAEFKDAAAAVRAELRPAAKLLIGGKSMGGRVASLVADELYGERQIAGLVCLGYPFHPPGKPKALRTAHLEHLRCPALVVQGERDPFGTHGEVEALQLSPSIRLMWAGDGDHDLGPRGGSGFTRAGNLAAAADAIAAFAAELPVHNEKRLNPCPILRRPCP
jgi:predicted alpha/beta-hydrolase family hydrolase